MRDLLWGNVVFIGKEAYHETLTATAATMGFVRVNFVKFKDLKMMIALIISIIANARSQDSNKLIKQTKWYAKWLDWSYNELVAINSNINFLATQEKS